MSFGDAGKHRIANEIRFGLPNQRHNAYLAKLFSPLGPPTAFALDLDDKQFDQVYVSRGRVESEILVPGNRVILGPRGRGKTSLLRRLPHSQEDRWLKVALELLPMRGAGVPSPLAAPNPQEPSSPLILSSLTRRIFETYWEDFFVKDRLKQRDRLLGGLRHNRDWMEAMRWLFQKLAPSGAGLDSEFEFMAWLHGPCADGRFNSAMSPRDMLLLLLAVVTALPRQDFGRAPSAVYDGVQVFIDAGDNAEDVPGILQAAESLHNLQMGSLGFKFFVNSALEDSIIKEVPCVYQGRLPLYHLPDWTDDELRRLLEYRMRMAGEYTLSETEAGVEALSACAPSAEELPVGPLWSTRFPELSPDAQKQLPEIIIRGARRMGESGDDLDTPVHALRLARGAVAACAGCWAVYDQHYDPLAGPLTPRHIEELIDLYWSHSM